MFARSSRLPHVILSEAKDLSQRLNAARRELRHGGPDTVVADVANHQGFWHMGQFAADYRRMFGELPRETLARAR